MKKTIAPSEVFLDYTEILKAQKSSPCFDDQPTPRMKPCDNPILNLYAQKILLHKHASTYLYAKKMGMTRAVFGGMVRQVSGFSSHAWRNYAVIQMAYELLATTRRTATSIGRELGFSRLQDFNKFFHGEAKCSPSAWRAANRITPDPMAEERRHIEAKVYRQVATRLLQRGTPIAEVAQLLEMPEAVIAKMFPTSTQL